MDIVLKRIYDAPDAGDGTRVLVDRLWPRGMKKVDAHLDLWDKNLAPSVALRKWWNHDPAKMTEFSARYCQELDTNPHVAELLALAHQGKMTLLYAARDPQVNHARILREYLLEH